MAHAPSARRNPRKKIRSPNTTANPVIGQNGDFTTTNCNDGTAPGDLNGLGPDSLCAPRGIALDAAS